MSRRRRLLAFVYAAFFACATYVFVNALFELPKRITDTSSETQLVKEQPLCIGRKTYCVCENGTTPQVEDIDIDAKRKASKTGCNEAYVTLLTSDYYLPGTLVFIHSIRTNMEANRDIVVVITEGVSDSTIEALQASCVIIKRVKSLGNPNGSYQPRFEDAYTKMAIWTVDEYDKLVYGDSDQFAIKSYDSLFEYEPFSAEERTYGDHRYTSSLMVLQPSRRTFKDMKSKFKTLKSDDGADMGFISAYFPQQENKTIPYYFAIWRRTIKMSPSHWDWDKIHGIDCSGWKPEKPWAPEWFKNVEKEYHVIYKMWWNIYYEMLGMDVPTTLQEYKTIAPEDYPQRLKQLYWKTPE